MNIAYDTGESKSIVAIKNVTFKRTFKINWLSRIGKKLRADRPWWKDIEIYQWNESLKFKYKWYFKLKIINNW